MTSTFDLNLPIDIPWERICVSRDMLEPIVCSDDLPPKWQTSVAVFRYVPTDDYQNYPDYKVTYLKVTASISGYQPKDKEIEAAINWDGINVETINDVEALLDSYLPCTGALLQVVVGLPDEAEKVPVSRGPARRRTALDKLPFFLDFEPKSRSLYEMATDTQELSSRSQDELNVGKSAGSLDSTEVLDVDQGGSQSFGAQGSYAGTGGGFQESTSHQGQWGTKSMGSRTGEVQRAQDHAQERRETQSHTTQISQLYHLLDGYHLGTNRALFFIQPRPHVLEQPSGFVRGPRPVEGLQEFFMVVAQPKDQEDFCVSVRLDTSHLTQVDILDYDYRKDQVSVQASASAPTRRDDPTLISAERVPLEVDYPWGGKLGDRWYQCYVHRDTESTTYVPPWSDFKIDVSDNGGYTDSLNQSDHGSTSVTVSPDGESLTVTCIAEGHQCWDDGGCVCVDCPDTINSWASSARRDIVVNLISREPTKKVGTKQVVVTTARGVCCCAKSGRELPVWDKDVVLHVQDVANLYTERGISAPGAISGTTPQVTPRVTRRAAGMFGQLTGEQELLEAPDTASAPPGTMSIREANELSDLLRVHLLSVHSSARVGRSPTSLVYTDLFIYQLQARLRQHGFGRKALGKPVGEIVPRTEKTRLSRAFGVAPDQFTCSHLAGLSNAEVARIAQVGEERAARMRLEALGVTFTRPAPKRGTGSRSPKTSRS